MLSVTGVTEKIGGRKVLDDVSFEARAGRITGVIGPHGSGKTVLARILMGLIEPDAGKVILEDAQLETGDRQNFGYLPQERGQYPDMHVLEQITYFARLHGMSLGAAERNGVTLLKRLELADRAYAKLGHLAASELARVEIATILAADPDVVVLDEPFDGLDAAGADLVFDLLRDHADSGVPVVFFSKNWASAQAASDDVVILGHGKVVDSGERTVLSAGQDESDSSAYRVELGSVEQAGVFAETVAAQVGVTGARADGPAVTFRASSRAQASAAVLTSTEGTEVVSFGPTTHTLEELYRESI